VTAIGNFKRISIHTNDMHKLNYMLFTEKLFQSKFQLLYWSLTPSGTATTTIVIAWITIEIMCVKIVSPSGKSSWIAAETKYFIMRVLKKSAKLV